MKPILLVLCCIIALCSCHSNQSSVPGKQPPDLSDIKTKAKPVTQNVPDRIYTGLKPGDIAPDAVKIDADKIIKILNGTCIIKKGKEEALIDFKGNFITEFGFYQFPVEDYNASFNTLYHVQDERMGGQGFLNVKGEEVFVCIMGQACTDFNAYGLAQFTSGSDSKWADITGHAYAIRTIDGSVNNLPNRNAFNQPQVIDAMPTERQGTKEALRNSPESMDGYAYADRNDKQTFPERYAEAGWFTDGLAPVRVEDRQRGVLWGYIDRKGKMVIEPNFTNRPGQFHNGLALIRPKFDAGVDFRYAYIDKKGNIKIKIGDHDHHPPAPWDGTFINGYAFWDDDLVVNGKYFIDTLGNKHHLSELIKNPDFIANDEGMAIYKYTDLGIFFGVSQKFYPDGGGQGLIDYQGNILFPPAFETITPDYYSHYAIASVVKGNVPGTTITDRKTGIINRQGVFVLIAEPKKTL